MGFEPDQATNLPWAFRSAPTFEINNDVKVRKRKLSFKLKSWCEKSEKNVFMDFLSNAIFRCTKLSVFFFAESEIFLLINDFPPVLLLMLNSFDSNHFVLYNFCIYGFSFWSATKTVESSHETSADSLAKRMPSPIIIVWFSFIYFLNAWAVLLYAEDALPLHSILFFSK